MLTIIEAMMAFLFARAIWDYIKRRAQACQIHPLGWMLKVLYLCFALFLIIGIPLGASVWILMHTGN